MVLDYLLFDEESDSVRCIACERKCIFDEDSWGYCGVRGLKEQAPAICSSFLGAGTSPIEKKPFYHFHSGKDFATVGFEGCNLHCP
ncbi:MAG: hypothetical protein GF309_13330 [Candidatus Lokiarchaeota archaeon]|nr:hypothetical protein [Candidatus Lokiarchaeota archaeon]